MHKEVNQDTFRSFQTTKKGINRNKYRKQSKIQSVDRDLYSDQVYRKFLKILNARRQRYLKQHLVQYYGKNFPIDYREHYQFEQGWQNKRKHEQKEKEYYSINESSSILQLIIAILTIVIYPLTIWLTNLDFFFNKTDKVFLYHQVYSIAFFIVLIHFLIKVLKKKKQNQNTPQILEIIKSQYLLVIVMGYLIAKLAGVNNRDSLLWTIFQMLILLIFYGQASKMYQCIRLTNFSLQFQYQTKVIDMVITVFIIAHFMAIVLYLTTHLNPQNNWMTSLNFDKSNHYALYIYSFYFCSTTIMTVGYGDITPKNQLEVVIVILVQIFGVIVLGYIINQIGYCVSSLRRNQQLIEKDLSVVQKIRKHYQMDAQLANRVREYIVNSKPNTNQLSPEEQQGIMVKLNEQIRLDMSSQNMLSVVKSSLFFLCRWTKHFQTAISSRLIHMIFNPNDLLYQPDGNERIYIIKTGKIDIYAGRNSKRLHNVLKTINTSVEKEVSDNCYGYTGVISFRKPKIYAVSKGFTSAYYINKDKFKECVNDKIADFQYYHQMKTKMDQARLCESIQISTSQSTKHHYNPTRGLLIKKECKANNPQPISAICRRQINLFRGNKQICDSSMKQQLKNKFMGSYAQLYDDSQVDDVKVNSTQTIKGEEVSKGSAQISLNTYFTHQFESGRQYTNYYGKSNKSDVLKILDKEQFITSSYKQSNH